MSSEPTIDLYSERIPASELRRAGELMRSCFGADDAEPDFDTRVMEKRRPLLIMASRDGVAIGFKLGYEFSRGVFSSWLGGILPEMRRQGIATALLRAQHQWVANHGYHTLLTESANRFKGMIILNLLEGFEIVGTRWSHRRQSVGIQFAKHFEQPTEARRAS